MEQVLRTYIFDTAERWRTKDEDMDKEIAEDAYRPDILVPCCYQKENVPPP